MILFKKTPYSEGLVNMLIHFFGGSSVDFIDGPYWAKMFVLCFYTIWVVMPFKVLILTSALASVNQVYYNAARVDGTSPARIFRITRTLCAAKPARTVPQALRWMQSSPREGTISCNGQEESVSFPLFYAYRMEN